MNEWKDPSKELPKEGESVEILLGARKIKPVLFEKGRFWKFRKGRSGHAYAVNKWRPIEERKRGRQIDTDRAETADTKSEY